MTEANLLRAFHESLVMDVNDALRAGLHPGHIANLMLMASVEIVTELSGAEAARKGLLLAADNLEAGE